jgi:hypothetical protein
MNNPRFSASVAVGFAMLMLVPQVVIAAGKTPSVLVPKDTMIYAGIRNCDELGESFKRTAMWRMFEDPATKELKQSWTKIGTKLKEYAAKKLNLASPKQLDVVPHGAVGVYLSLEPPKEEGAEPEVFGALVMEMGEDAEKSRTVIDAIVQKSIDHGGKKDTRELGGGEIISVRFEPEANVSDEMQLNKDAPLQEVIDEIVDLIGDDLPGGLPKEFLEGMLSELQLPEEIVFAFRKDVVVLASSRETAAKVLRTLNDDGENSFAGSKAIKALGRRLSKDAQIEAVIDIPKIVETLAKRDEEAKSVITALGVNTFGPMLYVTDFAPTAGIEARASGFMKIGDKTSGLGKIFMMSNSKVTAPATVTGDSVGFGSLNLNPAELLEEIIAIVTRINVADGESFANSMVVPQPDGSMFDFRKDLVAHLIGPIVGNLSIEKPYSPENYGFFVSIGHKSREAWDKVIHMIPPGILITREMMGATVMDVALPVAGLSMGLTDRSFVWIGTTSEVEGYIRREGRSEGGLADAPEFRRLAKLMPKQASGVMYFNGVKLHEARMAAEKAGFMATEQPPMFGPVGGMLQWMIVRRYVGSGIENPEALKKYQPLSMATIVSQDDGIRFDQVQVSVEPVD